MSPFVNRAKHNLWLYVISMKFYFGHPLSPNTMLNIIVDKTSIFADENDGYMHM